MEKLHEKSKLSTNHFILMCMLLPKKLLLKAKRWQGTENSNFAHDPYHKNAITCGEKPQGQFIATSIKTVRLLYQ